MDIDFDMRVENKNDKYYVAVNKGYCLDEEFRNEQEAENRMLNLAYMRNKLEENLLSDV